MILCGSNVDAFIAGYQALKRKHGWFKGNGIADRKSKLFEYLRNKYRLIMNLGRSKLFVPQ